MLVLLLVLQLLLLVLLQLFRGFQQAMGKLARIITATTRTRFELDLIVATDQISGIHSGTSQVCTRQAAA